MASNEHHEMSGNPCDWPYRCEHCGREFFDDGVLCGCDSDEDAIFCSDACAREFDEENEVTQ